MCVEKSFALYFPLKAKVFSNVTIAKRVCAVIVLIYVVMNVPLLFSYEAVENEYGLPVCKVRYGEAIQDLVYSLMYSIIPLLLLILFSFAIIVKITRFSKGTKLKTMAKQGTMMLLSVIIFFIISTIPMTLYSSFGLFAGNANFLVLSLILSSTNHSINALLYMLSGSKYREGVKKMFRRKNKVSIAIVAPPN